MLTRTIKPMWRDSVTEKRANPWTAKKWDEYGGIFIALPGGKPGERFCLVANNVTGAWGRFTDYDATCWIRLRADMFFGTQDGIIMQAERTGLDDGRAYVCTLVGGWEMFGAPSATFVWHQARATFKSSRRRAVRPAARGHGRQPRLSFRSRPRPAPTRACATCGTRRCGGRRAPSSRHLPADIAQYGQWDQPALLVIPARNTMWISYRRDRFRARAHRADHGGAAGQAGRGADRDRGGLRACGRECLGRSGRGSGRVFQAAAGRHQPGQRRPTCPLTCATASWRRYWRSSGDGDVTGGAFGARARLAPHLMVSRALLPLVVLAALAMLRPVLAPAERGPDHSKRRNGA